MPRFLSRIFLVVAAAATGLAGDAIDFNRQILPILSDACFRCHGPDAGTREADLRLDQGEGLFRTKNDLTVVTPGKPDESELFLRITSEFEDEVMPPRDSNRPLKPAEIDLLKRWIAAGAPWGAHWAFSPPTRPEVPVVGDREPGGREARAARPRPGEPPGPTIRNPIDAFVRAKLSEHGLTPSPEASRAALLRRVSLDLTGVPPTPAELDAFLAEGAPDAYERAVDRMMASPRYGERWAWEWLDVARYADTNGFQGDPERTMWPWRDWVVNALNANMPFDQFTIEQLAGDLLPDATRDQKLASGFHRNNMFNGEGGRIAEETRVENVFDRVETTATVWLGMTFTCARCHDHKYDPILQKDFYALYDIFNQMSETGSTRGSPRNGQLLPVLDLSSDAERERVKKAGVAVESVAEEVAAFELKKFPRPEGKPMSESPDAMKLPGNLPATLAKVEPKRRGVDGLLEAIPYFQESDPAYAGLLQALLDAVRERNAANDSITRVMIMDHIPEPRETFILNKGSYEAKTDVQVFGAIPTIFRSSAPTSAGESTNDHSLTLAATGGGKDADHSPTLAATEEADNAESPRLNRLDLARWLVSPANPLAARVTVNRAWQAFFGTGFVKTAEDFGVQSEPPSHPELLDWLAVELVHSGWDMKALHRLIVTSATYRQSSRVTPAAHERDPENRLLARGPRHRLPSWMLRDQALALAGLLVEKQGGPSVKPYQPAGIWEEATFGKKTYQQNHGEALYRRSLYIFWRRIVGPTTFFDAGARQVCTVKVARTNTPLHALVTLNDPAFVEAARVMAQRVIAWSALPAGETAHASDSERVQFAFRLATSRLPTTEENKVLVARLGKLRGQFAADPGAAAQLASAGEAPRPDALDPVEHAAWTALCSLILNLDETLSKE